MPRKGKWVRPLFDARCPKCGQWGQFKARTRNRNRLYYLNVDHYRFHKSEKKRTRFHRKYRSSCYLGPCDLNGNPRVRLRAVAKPRKVGLEKFI